MTYKEKIDLKTKFGEELNQKYSAAEKQKDIGDLKKVVNKFLNQNSH